MQIDFSKKWLFFSLPFENFIIIFEISKGILMASSFQKRNDFLFDW